MSSLSSSSRRRYNSSILCTCKLPVRVLTHEHLKPHQDDSMFVRIVMPVGKHCDTWDLYDPELEHDWYRFELFDMYNLLNPQQRHQHQVAMMREERIQESGCSLGSACCFPLSALGVTDAIGSSLGISNSALDL
ncbi:hypothetical protein Tco_0559668 [Tanacetum coccineum]